MRLLVGVPAFNESATIARVIQGVPRDVAPFDEVDVVVVDDGSSDDTGKLAEKAGATVIRHIQNRGLGNAFRSMVGYAIRQRADVLVTIDGDGQFDSTKIPDLLAPILDGRALVSTASRFLKAELIPEMPRVKIWGNHRVANLVSMLTGRRYADVSCGFRAYSREALLRMTVYHSFTYTHETFLDLAAKDVPIEEVPMKVRGVREAGKSRIASSVLRYGFRTALIMLRTYRDQKPLRLCFLIAAPLVLAAIGLLTWSFVVWWQTESWLKASAFAGAALGGVGVATLFVGFMADMATRLRRNQEEVLYLLRQMIDRSE